MNTLRRRLLVPAVMATTVAATVSMVQAPVVVDAATFIVTTTIDEHLAVSNATVCASAHGCSLRAAIEAADNAGGATTITVLAGTYDLTLGALQIGTDPTGQTAYNVTINGAGAATTIINQTSTPSDHVFNLDTNIVGNVVVSMSNLTVSGGTDQVDGYGGGGIVGGSGTATTADSLSLSGVVVTGNHTTNATVSNSGGGGMQWIGGNLTITNSTFSNNSSKSSSGGGVFVQQLTGAATVSITGSVFSGNTIDNQTSPAVLAAGAGLAVETTPGSTVTISGDTFSGNSATSTGSKAPVTGGGLYLEGPGTVKDSTFTGNTASGPTDPNNLEGGGAISASAGTAAINFNRITGNAASHGPSGLLVNTLPAATLVNATDNWWGCNTPPSGAGCDTIFPTTSGGKSVINPWVQLTGSASPNKIKINTSSTVTGAMKDSNGNTLADVTVLAGLPVTFGSAVLGSVPQAQPETLSSQAAATATFNAGANGGNGSVAVTVDQQTVTVPITVLAPPLIGTSFGANTIAVNGTTTANYSLHNGNTVTINGSFTDTLPTGLVVGSTPSVSNTCGGTVTAVAGSQTVSWSNAAFPVGICSIAVNVTGTVDAIDSNSVTIDSTDAGNGNTSSASLTVINAPHVLKQFGASSIPLGGSTSLSFTLDSNGNQNLTLNGVAFTDSLPAGVVVASPNNLSNNCGGTATAVAGAGTVSLSGASVAPSSSCTVSLNVTATSAGAKNNSVQVSSTNGGTGNTSSASVTAVAPPTLAESFGAPSIPLNGTTSMGFQVTNLNAGTALSGVGFSDSLPSGLVVANPPNIVNSCSGASVTAVQGTGIVSVSGGNLPADSMCSISVDVTGVSAGTQANPTGNITSTEGGTGGTATSFLDVEAPPTIAKAFNPTTVALNATTSLTFTLDNPAANPDALSGVAFSDTLPTGLSVADASATVCGGTVTTTASTGVISLSGATIAAGGECQFGVTVTGGTSGQYTNTTGNVTSTNGGAGNSASANLTVASAPSITKSFGAATIPLDGTTSLSFDIENPNTTLGLTGVSFTDSLPAGLVVSSTPNLNNTCGGTATATPSSSSVTLSGGTLAGAASCTVSVDVQGTAAGLKNNSVQVSANEGGTGNTSNASITVVAPPTISDAFGAASIPLNASTSLTFNLANPNTGTDLNGVGFVDTLPAGLEVSTPNGLSGTCGGGTITASAGGSVVSLSGATLPASGSCSFSVDVTGIAAGQQNDSTGNVTSNEGGTGGAGSASIDVEAPPSIAKAFNPGAISLGATTSLNFTITNPAANVDPLSGVAFTDTLPTGLSVANATATVCGGTATTTASTGISLSGATIAAGGQCQFGVTVTGSASGEYTNTTGNVTSTNGGTGNTASADLEVASPPSITKSFGSATVPLNGTSTLTFALHNPNTAVALTGVAFTDSLPSGLTVAGTPNLGNTCGGTATATAGASSVALSGGALAAGTDCTMSVDVEGVNAGAADNSVQVSSNEGGTGNTSNASITVVAPPHIQKSFGAPSIPVGGTTSLSFQIDNANTGTTLNGVGFSDSLPAGLAVATPNGLSGNCGGGTVTATAGSSTVSLSGGSVAASGSCTVIVNVTGVSAGAQNNTTGNVTSTEGGTGDTGSASIDVVAPPSIAKAFSPTAIPVGAPTSLTFTITNPASNVDPENGVAFSDTLPAGLGVATSSAPVCGGTLTTTAATRVIALSGATVGVGAQCQFSVTVTGLSSGHYTNTTGAVTSSNGGTGNTASAPLTVAVPPALALGFGAANVPLHQNTTLTATLTNPPANTVPLTGVGFSAPLPAGLVVATPNAANNTCGGTLTANAGGSTVTVSGVGLGVGGSCAVTVAVTGTGTGTKSVSAIPTSDQTGSGSLANAVVVVTTGGYWLAAGDGGVFSYGNAVFGGSEGGRHLNAPVVGIAAPPGGLGYWLAAADGGVFTEGLAGFHGSAVGMPLNAPVVGIAASPDGQGYWLVAADGGVFSFGTAHFHGSAVGTHLNAPIVGITAAPDGGGYWLVAADGGVFAFGSAHFHGSEGGVRLNAPVVGMASTADGLGYWLLGADGGVFSFGSAVFHGSAVSLHLSAPAVGMARTPTGAGYWLVGADGGVFAYGDAINGGFASTIRLNRPVVGIASTGV